MGIMNTGHTQMTSALDKNNISITNIHKSTLPEIHPSNTTRPKGGDTERTSTRPKR